MKTCNLCGGADLMPVSEVDRYGFPVRSVACTSCGLVFVSPRLTRDAYGRFYDGTYRPLVSAFHGRLIDAESVEAEQAPYAERVAELLRPYLPRRDDGSILDVGGSTGVVSARIGNALTMDAVVLDPAPAEVERARARGLEGVVGTIEEWDSGGRRFDLVLLCQTIDHLLDVSGSLAAIRRAIAEDGVFFVDIVDFLAAYRHGGSVASATKIDHPYSLTELTAEAFLSRAGFQQIHRDHAPDGLHVGYVCRPGDPDAAALPSHADVVAFLNEIGAVG